MIRRVINGIEVVETIKPVTCGDEGMIYARFFLPCHCVRENKDMAMPSARAFASGRAATRLAGFATSIAIAGGE